METSARLLFCSAVGNHDAPIRPKKNTDGKSFIPSAWTWRRYTPVYHGVACDGWQRRRERKKHYRWQPISNEITYSLYPTVITVCTATTPGSKSASIYIYIYSALPSTITILHNFMNFLTKNSEPLSGTSRFPVFADSVSIVIFKPLIGMIHVIHRWIATEIAKLLVFCTVSKFCMDFEKIQIYWT